GYGYGVGALSALDRTTDNGRTWTKIKVPISHIDKINGGTSLDSSFNTVYTLDTSRAIVIGWDGLIYFINGADSGFLPSGTSERLHGIAFASRDTGIIVGDYGTILRSTDRG